MLFYPTYNADGDADKIEFLAFFVPYALSLILETYTLVKILNKSWVLSKKYRLKNNGW